METQEAWLALNLIPKLGPVTARKLLSVFGAPQSILSARAADLRQVEGVGQELASAIAGWENTVDLSSELEQIHAFGAKVVTLDSPDYPKLLREIHDPPMVLYVWGEFSERDAQAIGVVGSRRASHYGIASAKRLSYQLAYAGLTVVSGLARGIDTAAHQGALAAKGRTIAVLGSGLANLYPPENLALAELIAGSGAVVSEYPMGREADRQTFPYRNRIVSGCSFGLLVVEAGFASGAMITAGQAGDQGRSLYAVPGPIDRPTSQGCNRLIQQGAKLVMGASDVLDDLGLLFRDPPELSRSRPAAILTDEERAVYDAIGENETGGDTIIEKSRLPSGVVSSSLLALELKRLVKPLPGNRFVKLL